MCPGVLLSLLYDGLIQKLIEADVANKKAIVRDLNEMNGWLLTIRDENGLSQGKGRERIPDGRAGATMKNKIFTFIVCSVHIHRWATVGIHRAGVSGKPIERIVHAFLRQQWHDPNGQR